MRDMIETVRRSCCLTHVFYAETVEILRDQQIRGLSQNLTGFRMAGCQLFDLLRCAVTNDLSAWPVMRARGRGST